MNRSLRYMVFLIFLLILKDSFAQTSFCNDDPPLNPWLADSPYPIYHRNSYGQASTCIEGIQPGDSVQIKLRRDITGGTSPWVYLSEKYQTGERTLLYSNSTHVFKFIDNGSAIVPIDSIRLDFDTLRSNGYNHLLAKDNIWYSYEPSYAPEDNKFSQLFKFSDVDPTDPYSKIQVLDTLDFGDYGINRVNMYNINYNGEIVWYSEKDPERNVAYAGVIDSDFNMLDILEFEALPNERVNHNSISVDEENNYYIVTSNRLIQFAWDGTNLEIGWQAEYDFVNDGPTGNFAYGSGTTPTLMGWGEGNDKLVVVADGHAQNNLVAFWRELPEGWQGISGQPLHFADAISIPNAQSFSNLFQSIENSPTAYGYEIAIAQFNGFLGYDCDNLKGVSKFRWDEQQNQFELSWTNDEVNMNGVLTYSSGSNLVYGTGKEVDCNYYYYGLDWNTGEVALQLLLGAEETFPDDPFYDQGVNNIIDEDGSIYFSGSRSLVKLERIPSTQDEDDDQEEEENDHSDDDNDNSGDSDEDEDNSDDGMDEEGNENEEQPSDQENSTPFILNPTQGELFFNNVELTKYSISLFDSSGRWLTNLEPDNENQVNISQFPRGLYFIIVQNRENQLSWKVLKTD